MIKKMTALLAIAAAASIAVTVAQAGASTSHSVQLAGDGSGIYHYPFVGASGTSAFGGTLGKTSAIVEHWIGPSSNCTGTCTFSGTVTVFGPKGSYSGTITSGTVYNANEQGPPTKAQMTVKVNAGSGLYAHATGTVTVTNTYIDASPGTYTITVKGTIKY